MNCPRCGERDRFSDEGVCGSCGGTFDPWWARWGVLVAISVVSFAVALLLCLAIADPH